MFAMFADNDSLVDDDADGHDHAEQADHVDALAGRQHDAHGGHQGNRNPRRHPKSHPGIKEDEQNHHHQHQPRRPVAQQQVDTATDQIRRHRILLDGDFGGELGSKFRDIGIHDFRLIQRIGMKRTLDVELDRRP